MKLLIDTNVLIDFFGRKPPFFQDAERVVASGYFGDAELWASTQSFKDAFYILSKFVDPARLQDAFSNLLEVVRPIDLTGSDLENALRLKWDDLEDCLIALAAQKVGADYLITRDQKGFARSLVPTLSPAEWLTRVKETNRTTYDSGEW